MTWFSGNYGYGRLINSDGSLYGSEITIRQVSSASYSSLAFDPINGRFLQAIWRDFFIRGQLIDAEGNLFGDEFQISPPENAPDTYPYFSIVFDTANNKFLLVGSTSIANQYIAHGIYGQLLNPDGSLSGAYFRILRYSRKPELYRLVYRCPCYFWFSENGISGNIWGLPQLGNVRLRFFRSVCKSKTSCRYDGDSRSVAAIPGSSQRRNRDSIPANRASSPHKKFI